MYRVVFPKFGHPVSNYLSCINAVLFLGSTIIKFNIQLLRKTQKYIYAFVYGTRARFFFIIYNNIHVIQTPCWHKTNVWEITLNLHGKIRFRPYCFFKSYIVYMQSLVQRKILINKEVVKSYCLCKGVLGTYGLKLKNILFSLGK